MWKHRTGHQSQIKVRGVFTLGCGVVPQHVGAPAGKEGCLVRDRGSRERLATHRVREPGSSQSKKVVINMEKDKI